MDCQKQSNGNASWGVLYTVLIGFGRLCRSLSLRVNYILTLTWGFNVARFDNPGNAKALTSGTSDRTGSTFLIFVYMTVRIVINSVVAKSQNLSNYGYCIKTSNCSKS